MLGPRRRIRRPFRLGRRTAARATGTLRPERAWHGTWLAASSPSAAPFSSPKKGLLLLLLPLLRDTRDVVLRFPVSRSRIRSFLSGQFFLASSTALMTWNEGGGVVVGVSLRRNGRSPSEGRDWKPCSAYAKQRHAPGLARILRQLRSIGSFAQVELLECRRKWRN